MNPPINWINTDAVDKSSAILSGYTAQAQSSSPPQFYPGDVIQMAYAFLANASPGAVNPFVNLDSSAFLGFTVEAGVLGQEPDAGVFALTLSGGGTGTAGGIAFNAPANTGGSSVQAIIRAGMTPYLDSAIVTGDPGGPYEIDDNDATNVGFIITSDSSGLMPDGSKAIVVKTQDADGTLSNRWIITLTRAFLIFQETWSPLDPVTFNLTPIQAGSSTPPLSSKSFSLTFNTDAIGGAFNITATAPNGTTTGTIGPIPFDVDNVTFEALFTNGPGVTPANGIPVSIVQNSVGNYTITCQNDWINSSVVNLVMASNTLQVPIGLRADLTVSVAGAQAIFDGVPDTETTAPITLTMRLTPSFGQVATVVQTQATLYRTFPVGGGPATGQPAYLTIKSGMNVSGITALTGGAGTLEGISTVSLPNYLFLYFYESQYGLLGSVYQLMPGTASTNPPSIVLPLDYNASTNAKYWEVRS